MATTTDSPWTIAQASGASGFVTELPGGPVHWVRWDADPDAVAEPILFVHGLGGSHLNWTLVAPELAQSRGAYAVDLRGFGLSPGAPHADSGVRANADLVIAFIEHVISSPVVLVGNSMGGMISAMVASRRPDLVHRLVLVDPALPLARLTLDPTVAARFALFSIPRAGEVVMRRARQRVDPGVAARQLIELCFADASRIRQLVIDQGMELARTRTLPEHGLGDLERSFMVAARSLLRTLASRPAYFRLLRDIDVPTLLIHGDRDRLVDVSSARAVARRHPEWAYAEMPGVGHTPQLEVPEEFIEIVSSWLAAVDAGTAQGQSAEGALRSTPTRAGGAS